MTRPHPTRPLLTREEEVVLANSIADAERAILEAVASSEDAVGELARLLEELGDGTFGTADFHDPALEMEMGDELAATEVLDALRRLQELQAASGRVDGGRPDTSRAEEARAHFVDTAQKHELSNRASDRLLARLASRRVRSASERRSLDRTIAAIRRSRAVAERARTVLVEANMGLVVTLAKRRSPQGLPLEDLIQEGSLGLMRAARKFDPRHEVRFGTYAAWWIRHFLNRALSDRSRTIRLPVHLLETRAKVARIAREFSQERGREPTEAELLELSAVSRERLRGVLEAPREPVSLDAPAGSETDARIGDFVADPDAVGPIDQMSAKHAGERLRELLGVLTPREQEVLRLRFALDRPDSLTLAEVGRRFSVSRERARQIEVEALAKLRACAAEEELDSLLAS